MQHIKALSDDDKEDASRKRDDDSASLQRIDEQLQELKDILVSQRHQQLLAKIAAAIVSRHSASDIRSICEKLEIPVPSLEDSTDNIDDMSLALAAFLAGDSEDQEPVAANKSAV